MRKLMTMLLGLSLVGGSAMFAAPKKTATKSKAERPKEVQKNPAAAKAAKGKAKSTQQTTQK